MENDVKMLGHFAALFSALMWGMAFVSSKVLLQYFEPVEVLFIRLGIGFLALFVICPHLLHIKDRRQEIWFAAAGLTGMCIYYLMENISLTYTSSANVCVIVSMSPFFTAIIMHLLYRDNHLGWSFFLGFVMAIVGISAISFSGQEMQLNPLGDLIALGAAVMWSIYCVILGKIGTFGYNPLQTTRRTFGYGLLFLLPVIAVTGFSPDLNDLAQPEVIAHFVFLGVVTFALCFATWGYATRHLGAVDTSVYMYLMPVITLIGGALLLDENVTVLSVAGVVLTIGGLLVSELLGRKDGEDPFVVEGEKD